MGHNAYLSRYFPRDKGAGQPIISAYSAKQVAQKILEVMFRRYTMRINTKIFKFVGLERLSRIQIHPTRIASNVNSDVAPEDQL